MSSIETDQGFAEDQHALDRRRAVASSLAGRTIVEVRYVNIDYRGWDLGHRDQLARRVITDDTEWAEPTWDAGGFHHLDFGVELLTDRGETWSITWDSPGPGGESIRLQRGPAKERGAVWAVTDWQPWRLAISSPLSEVALRYHRWSEGSSGFWCTRVSLIFVSGNSVEVLLGARDEPGVLAPSADTVAVLLAPGELPPWERTDDLT